MVARHRSHHFISYVNVEPLCRSPEANIILYVGYALPLITKQVSQHFMFPLFPLALFIWLLGSVSDGLLCRSPDQTVHRIPEEVGSQGVDQVAGTPRSPPGSQAASASHSACYLHTSSSSHKIRIRSVEPWGSSGSNFGGFSDEVFSLADAWIRVWLSLCW